MSYVYTCLLCEQAGEETKIPADEIGAVLMKQHLLSGHGVVA